MGRLCRAVVVGLAGLAWLSASPRPVFAADAACFDAYEKTQRLRKDGKLILAGEQALRCARDACPALLKSDCTKWSADIARDVPTVVFAAKDDAGQDVAASTVYVDDRKVADAIDGRPFPIDPGPHAVRFEAGDKKTQVNVVVASGEVNRRIEGRLTAAGATSARRGLPTASLVLGGVAAVGLVSFVSFAIAGRVEQGCAPTCTSSQVGTLRAEYAVADVSWITGLVALGGAVYFWLRQPAAPVVETMPVALRPPGTPASGLDRAPPVTALELDARAAPGGATFGVRGTF
jgi:hypothetical protein